MAVATITEPSSFAEKVLRDEGRVLVSFRAAGCLASQQLIPAIDELAKELDDNAKVVAVDVKEEDWRENAILREHNIKRLPVVMLFEGGKLSDFIGGTTTKKAIAEMVAGKRTPPSKVKADPAAKRAIKKPVLAVDAKSFDREVLQSDRPVLVHFHAAWCRQSLELLPEVEAVAKQLDARAKVVQVEFAADNAELLERFGVVRVPTLALYRGGEVVDQIFGAMKGGAKVGARARSCVGLTTAENIGQMVETAL
jgi:thioredoxin 1